MRFGALERPLSDPIEKVLTKQRRKLVAAGGLVRRDRQRGPPMVDHSMTPFGLTLAGALTRLRQRRRLICLHASRSDGVPARIRKLKTTRHRLVEQCVPFIAAWR